MRLWQGLCGVMLAACVGLALAPRSAGVAGAHGGAKAVVTVAKPASGVGDVLPVLAVLPGWRAEGDEASGMAYWELRDRMLVQGMNALPAATGQGGGAAAPALRTGDGLDALPRWQRQAELGAGDRS